ncbi:hypothetical protein AB0M02_25670 [Actinoplanes sp. NPDC051861]|uniref:hypothetical protein n=1 Tax=Actinoplanes sp. NPDC051861 TaxID=3155170 RepID=UPI00342C59B3
MSAPAHRQPSQRNRILALGLGLLFGLILLVVLLTQCGGDPETTPGGQGGPQVSASAGPSQGGGPPAGAEPSTSAVPPNGSAPAENPPGSAAPPDSETPADTEAGDETTTAPTPKGGVNAGGGSGATDRRVPFLAIGTFLLIAALGSAWYAVGRRSRA